MTNFSFEFFYAIFTQDALLLFLHHGAKKSKMTKNSNQGGPALKRTAITIINEEKATKFTSNSTDALPNYYIPKKKERKKELKTRKKIEATATTSIHLRKRITDPK